MQTVFSDAQLADPATRRAEAIIRKCVHCGFCNAACPTYGLTGDERDGPRGRIYLIKDMLESGTVSAAATHHLDRCLSCLACRSACPSGVDYMHLVDHARAVIHGNDRRGTFQGIARRVLGFLLSRAQRFRWLFSLARLAAPLRRILPDGLRCPLELLSVPGEARSNGTVDIPAIRRGRVLLLGGCVQPVFGAAINDATVRVLSRHGYQVDTTPGTACCGAITHHLGDREETLRQIRRNVADWDTRLKSGTGAILVNASGCGTQIKDYGYLLQDEPEFAAAAQRVSRATRDISEFLQDLAPLSSTPPAQLRVCYQGPCSMRHGQGITDGPARLLRAHGFEVVETQDAQACCGSAGTYNILQPELAGQLGRRKAQAIHATGAALVASGNLGCMMQLRQYLDMPVLHTVELLDWASGGPLPGIKKTPLRTALG